MTFSGTRAPHTWWISTELYSRANRCKDVEGRAELCVKLISWALSAARFSLYTCYQVRCSGKQKFASHVLLLRISTTWMIHARYSFLLVFESTMSHRATIDAHIIIDIYILIINNILTRETASAFIDNLHVHPHRSRNHPISINNHVTTELSIAINE